MLASDIKVSHQHIECISRIGEGGYGEVWNGRWNGSGGGITVAIKKIRVGGINPQMQKLLTKEVDILSSLRHPNIVPIYGACFHDVVQELWIVMEFMEGGSLFDLLHSDVVLDWSTRTNLALQAAMGLNVLHSREQEILHRDIKSLNYLVSRDRKILKLTDFGMSKVSVATATVSSGREAVGTIRWSAPETFSGSSNWTKKADIYSLGITLYEIAARKIPFEELSDNMRVMFQVHALKARPEIPVDCPESFASIVQACWDDNPDVRPSSIELVATLKVLASNYTTTVSAPFHSPISSNQTSTASVPFLSPIASEYFTAPTFQHSNPGVIVGQSTIVVAPYLHQYATPSVLSAFPVPDSGGRFSNAHAVETLAGSKEGLEDGMGKNAQFTVPRKICFNPIDECLYVPAEMRSSIRKITLEGNVSTIDFPRIKGCGPYMPTSVVFNQRENAVYVLSVEPAVVSKLSPDGTLSVVAHIPDGNYPLNDITIDESTGNMFVCNVTLHVIHKITPQGEVSRLAGSGDEGFADGNGEDAQFYSIWGMCFDAETRSLLVCDSGNQKIRRVSLNGGVTTLCTILSPIGIAITANGTILVTNGMNQILKVVGTGNENYHAFPLAGTGASYGKMIDGKPNVSTFHWPTGIAVHEPSHSCFVADSQNSAIRKISFK